MKRITFLLVTVATLAGVVAFTSLTSRRTAAAQEAAPIYGIKIPPGYRDWRMISIAHVGEPVNDLRVKLGNDLAIKAYRDGTPFPDGAIIARLAYRAVTSEENNKVFRAAAERQGLSPEQITKLLAGSLVAGTPTNVQFMVKDSKNMPRPAAGVSLNSLMANLMARWYTKPAFPATSPVKSTTSSSLGMHREKERVMADWNFKLAIRKGEITMKRVTFLLIAVAAALSEFRSGETVFAACRRGIEASFRSSA